MNSLEPGSHILAKNTAYLFDTDFNFLFSGVSITYEANNLAGNNTFNETHLQDFQQRLKRDIDTIKQGLSEMEHLKFIQDSIFS